MRVCIVHNFYRRAGGEATVVENTSSLLTGHGHVVIPFFRHSDEIPSMRLGKIRAFFSGIYNFSSKKAMRALLAECRPHTVHVHNLFPLISPSVLSGCRLVGVPIVMTLHNHRLSCPHAVHMVDGHVCERCKGGKEYWCILRNCEGNMPKSLGYAVRSLTARTLRLYADNVTIYIVFTQFHRNRLISEGIPSDRVAVVPSMVVSEQTAASDQLGDYVAFVGRVSPEKGITMLMRAARLCPEIPFKIAGGYEGMPHILGEVPKNVVFLGHLACTELREFYKSARMLVMPSTCLETFGMSLIEAMVWRTPTVVSRIGALTEVVDEGITGLAVEPNNPEDLSEKIRHLWDRPGLCRQMGQAGREKALREYSPDQYYERLVAVYQTAIRLGPPRCNSEPSGQHRQR